MIKTRGTALNPIAVPGTGGKLSILSGHGNQVNSIRGKLAGEQPVTDRHSGLTKDTVSTMGVFRGDVMGRKAELTSMT